MTKNKTQKEIAYNFFYDYTTKNKKLASEHTVLIQGIYMDDAANYSYIHDNIFYDGNYASMMIGGGQYNKVENNIIVDSNYFSYIKKTRLDTYNWEGQFEDIPLTANYTNLTHLDADRMINYIVKNMKDDSEKNVEENRKLF